MGALADAIQAGIPKEIVLPILPATQSFFGKGHGKAPARFNPAIGCWVAIDNWERGGLDKDLLIASEIAGCNAGVILGAYGVNLIAIDIDLRDTPNAVRWRDGIVRSFGRMWGRPLVIRETWPYRALLLVKLPPDADAGAKRIFTLYRPDPAIPGRGDSIGKIEILAHGQQAVIAGTHISGNQIQWSVNGEGERFPAPPIDQLPTFETFDALNDSVVALLEALGDNGFEYSTLSASRLTGHAPPMYELGAPDVEELISLLHAMPNPREADRDIYVNVMTAIAGAREGLVARRGAALTMNDEGRIANAAAVWAASWNAPPGTARSTVDIERAKWDNDWVRPRENRVAGWPSLLRHAAAFGAPAEVLQDIAMEQARNAFTADGLQPEHQVAIAAGTIPAFVPQKIDEKTPFITAGVFVDQSKAQGLPTLVHHDGMFRLWCGSHYRAVEDRETRAKMYGFLACMKTTEDAVQQDGTSNSFHPDRAKVDNVLDALRALTNLPSATTVPAWLDAPHADRPPAAEMVACSNGLLHLPAGKLIAHTPAFFSPSALEFAFDPNAPEPAGWLAFLASIWPDDQEAINTLQEMFGLFLTGETKYQKMFLIVGPTRSGKGTISRVLARLVGSQNMVGPTLRSLTGSFGLQPLIGKKLAVISDARFSRRDDPAIVAERMLAISGEDLSTVDRKGIDAWTGRLLTRFLILTNEIPALVDAAGAWTARFVILTMQKSFLNAEDLTLDGRLRAEMPGILNWAMVGAARLVRRGRFVNPASSAEVQREMTDLASPMAAFIRERCDVGPDNKIEKSALYSAWMTFCADQGVTRTDTKAEFGRKLRAALPQVGAARPREEGNRAHHYTGVALKPPTVAEKAAKKAFIDKILAN
jgi:putative DNA primase/helicase